MRKLDRLTLTQSQREQAEGWKVAEKVNAAGGWLRYWHGEERKPTDYLIGPEGEAWSVRRDRPMRLDPHGCYRLTIEKRPVVFRIEDAAEWYGVEASRGAPRADYGRSGPEDEATAEARRPLGLPAGDWRAVPGYAGRYWISRDGRVFGTRRRGVLRQIGQGPAANVYLRRDGERLGKPRRLAEIMMEAWVGPPPEGAAIVIAQDPFNPGRFALDGLSYAESDGDNLKDF